MSHGVVAFGVQQSEFIGMFFGEKHAISAITMIPTVFVSSVTPFRQCFFLVVLLLVLDFSAYTS